MFPSGLRLYDPINPISRDARLVPVCLCVCVWRGLGAPSEGRAVLWPFFRTRKKARVSPDLNLWMCHVPRDREVVFKPRSLEKVMHSLRMKEIESGCEFSQPPCPKSRSYTRISGPLGVGRGWNDPPWPPPNWERQEGPSLDPPKSGKGRKDPSWTPGAERHSKKTLLGPPKQARRTFPGPSHWERQEGSSLNPLLMGEAGSTHPEPPNWERQEGASLDPQTGKGRNDPPWTP